MPMNLYFESLDPDIQAAVRLLHDRGFTPEDYARAQGRKPDMAQPPSGLLPLSEWVRASRSDKFYRVMVEGCFEDAEDLARFLLTR